MRKGNKALLTAAAAMLTTVSSFAIRGQSHDAAIRGLKRRPESYVKPVHTRKKKPYFKRGHFTSGGAPNFYPPSFAFCKLVRSTHSTNLINDPRDDCYLSSYARKRRSMLRLGTEAYKVNL